MVKFMDCSIAVWMGERLNELAFETIDERITVQRMDGRMDC